MPRRTAENYGIEAAKLGVLYLLEKGDGSGDRVKKLGYNHLIDQIKRRELRLNGAIEPNRFRAPEPVIAMALEALEKEELIRCEPNPHGRLYYITLSGEAHLLQRLVEQEVLLLLKKSYDEVKMLDARNPDVQHQQGMEEAAVHRGLQGRFSAKEIDAALESLLDKKAIVPTHTLETAKATMHPSALPPPPVSRRNSALPAQQFFAIHDDGWEFLKQLGYDFTPGRPAKGASR